MGAFLVITGPTASGKTAFATQLTQRLAIEKCPIEIINCDVGQFYTPLSIGTAKPDLSPDKIGVPHHLFNLVSTPESFSAAAYRKQAVACVQEIWARNALPVFVGGSLFYIKALFFPPQEIEEQAPDLNPDLNTEAAIETSILWDKLYQIDAARALAIDKNDRYRIVRALTLWQRTGRLPSSCAPVFSPIGEQACVIAVTHDREILNARINARVCQMFDQGLRQEVAGLGPEWREFLSKKKLIGYHELLGLSENHDENHDENVVETIQQNTRAYAKRQMTFLRAFLGTLGAIEAVSVIKADLTLSDDYLYIEQIVAWANEHKKLDKNC